MSDIEQLFNNSPCGEQLHNSLDEIGKRLIKSLFGFTPTADDFEEYNQAVTAAQAGDISKREGLIAKWTTRSLLHEPSGPSPLPPDDKPAVRYRDI